MKASIVILAYNNYELTKKCLDSLDVTGVSKCAEIIVIDNNSCDQTQEALIKRKNIKYVRNSENLGFSKACNQGARISTGEIVVFLNNDTEVMPGWLEPLLYDFRTERKLGAVGSKLLFPSGKTEHAGVVFLESKLPMHLYRLQRASAERVNKRRYFQAVTAASMAVPRKVFLELGGFDESYHNGLEDIDFCLRLGEKKYKVLYEPKSVALHHESAAPGRHLNTSQNYDRFISLWKNKVVPDLHKYMKEDGYGRMKIKITDIVNMAYDSEKYGTVPKDILILRRFYLFPIKIYSFFKKGLEKMIGVKTNV